MDEPLVTVGMQFYNNEITLHSAIQSIVNQSYQNWELILHNDGSRDRSLEVASSFNDVRIKLFSDSVNRQRPIRLNESLDIAGGKYYAVMDGDDISYPDRLLKQVEYLEKNPSVDLCGAYMLVFDCRGKPIGKRKFAIRHKDICAKPWAGFPMAQPTFMGRIEWFKRYYYDLRARGGVEDQDLLLRAYNSSSFANLPDILVGYREPDLYFKKIIDARHFFIQSHIRKFKKQRNYRILFMAIVAQAMKCMIDGIAIGTGLKYRILKHRASLVTDAEVQDFENVWQSVIK